MPSGEMVAPMIDSFLRDKPRSVPAQPPERGPGPDLPPDVVVEAMCIADGDGLRRPRRGAAARRCSRSGCAASSAAQEATVEAALVGRPRQGGRGDAARSARGPHRLRPRRADDRRDARRHRAVAAAVRVSRSVRRVRRARRCASCDDVDEMARDAAVEAAAALRAAIARAGEANVMLATGNSQLVFLAELVTHARHRLGPCHARSTWTSTSGCRRRTPASFQRYMRERVAAHAAVRGVPLPRRRRGRPARPKRRATRRCSRAHPLDLCCCGHRRERAPRVQRSAGRRLRRPARREDRRARAGVAPPAGRRRPLRDDRRRADARDHRHDPRAARARDARARDRARGAQGAAGARRAVRADHHRVPGVDLRRRQPNATLYLDAESSALLES